MPDIFSKRKRSTVMAAIRSHGNKATELRLIAVFRAQGDHGLAKTAAASLRQDASQRPTFNSQRSTSKEGSGRKETES
jgi:hypothetical protein